MMTNLFEQTLTRIQQAEAIIVGASNGFSIAGGIHLFANDQAFRQYFGDLSERHGFTSIIQGCFHHYPGEADYWAFYSRMFNYFLNVRPPAKIMENLLALISDKNFFILTSNIDGHFVKAGIDQQQLFEIEGNCLNLQCAAACHDGLYDGTELLGAMVSGQRDGKVPDTLIPSCPECGGKMRVHIEVDRNFLKGSEWNKKYRAYRRFCEDARVGRTVFIELGVGARNQLIKAPFMQYVYQNPASSYITFNRGAELFIPTEITSQSIGIDGDIGKNLADLVSLNG